MDQDLSLSFLLSHAALALAVALAAHVDLRRRRIPNWLTFPLALAGLAAAAVRPELSLGASAAGLAVGLVIPFALFALGMLGAGDAKLVAAIGAWTGPIGVLWVILFTGVAGAVMALATAAANGQARSLVRNTAVIGLNLLVTRRTGWVSATEVARAPALQKSTLPYALAILMGLLGTQAMMIAAALAA